MEITIKNFSARYLEKPILENITLTFQPKTITAILGPSGCGKTTLLKCINRTAELGEGFKHTGEIYLQDINLYAADAAAVRHTVGLVFQKPVAFPFSVRENLLFGPRYYGEINPQKLDEIVEHSLRQVGLWEEVKDNLDRSAQELSAGQQQLLSIARVLTVRPKVLLLDKPCSNLDIVSTKVIEDLLVNLSHDYTIVIVTHNLSQAGRIAKETVFMSAGKIIESGPTAALLSAPLHPEIAEFFAAML